MGRILVTRRVPDGGLEPLTRAGHELVQRTDDRPYTHDELVEAAPTVDGIVCLLTDRIDRAVLEAGAAGGRLRVVANVAVGYDNIDVAAATELGIGVCNTPGVLDETTADLAFLLILAASRLAHDAEADLRDDRWKGWGILQYLGRDVHGATLGLVGFGRIGQAVARRATGFGMQVAHHTRHDTGLPGWVGDLDRLLAEVDVVSLHVPLTDATRHLIGARELGLMRPTAVLVNTARGPVVDEAALAAALEDRDDLRRGDRRVRTGARSAFRSCSRRRAPCCSRTSAARPPRPARAWRSSPARARSRCWPASNRTTSLRCDP